MPKCKEAPSAEKQCKYVNPDTHLRCTRESLAHELCWTHYQQERRGRPLTPIRPRGMVLLPGNVRVSLYTAAVLKEQVEREKKARSVYEATRQAIETGVERWSKSFDSAKKASVEKTMVKIQEEQKAKKAG